MASFNSNIVLNNNFNNQSINNNNFNYLEDI